MNSLPKTGCDLNPGPTAPESSTLTTRLLSHPETVSKRVKSCQEYVILRFSYHFAQSIIALFQLHLSDHILQERASCLQIRQ